MVEGLLVDYPMCHYHDQVDKRDYPVKHSFCPLHGGYVSDTPAATHVIELVVM